MSTGLQASQAGREYDKFRRLMTLEVNAAIEGAFNAGATEVLMKGAQRLNGMTTTCTGDDMIEVAEFFEVIHHIRPPGE